MSKYEVLFGTLASVVVLLGGVAALLRHFVKGYLHELVPNSGKSLKDQVNRLEHRVDEIYSILLENK